MPSRADDGKKETPTAVLLADSFSCHFSPITLESPKVLQRLVNTAMIDYTLAWLVINGIETVYITCCAFADQIKRHLEEAGYMSSSKRKNLHIELIVSTDCRSVGDAMRLLDHKDILKSDFVLVSGDVVTNMDLRGALETHQKRRTKDKMAIMTMVLKGGMRGSHRLRLGDLGALTVMDEEDNRLLKFEERRDEKADYVGEGNNVNSVNSVNNVNNVNNVSVPLDAGFFDGRRSVTVRTDLIDTGIYICSHEVLLLFSDNFDYQNIRKDFVAGVLSEEELGNKLYVHEVGDRYATRVRNVRCYAAVTRDIIGRWAFPFVPDGNLFSATVGGVRGDVGGVGANTAARKLELLSLDRHNSLQLASSTQYSFSKGAVYMETGVSVARSANVQHSVCVGRGSVIGPGAVVRESVIGKNCRIGEGVEIVGCVLGDDVVVHRGVTIRDSLICDGVVINERSDVQPNCILSYNVVIDSGVVVPEASRISLAKPVANYRLEMGSDDEIDDDVMDVMDDGRPSSFGTSPMDSYGFDGRASNSRNVSNVSNVSNSPISSEASAAAAALANGGVPASDMDFDTHVVGKMGAGYLWRVGVGGHDSESEHAANTITRLRQSIAYDVHTVLLDEQHRIDRVLAAEETFLEASFASKTNDLASEDSDDSEDAAMEMMQDHHFKEEVSETFLRCIKENISQENVVIELNGLKIAEDKTFADCARFILTTCLGLCLPAPGGVIAEYQGLYPEDRPANLRELLKRTHAKLGAWASLLQKFLKNEDDQIEVLLTLEEFCGAEGDFEDTGEFGAEFVAIFPQLLQAMYVFFDTPSCSLSHDDTATRRHSDTATRRHSDTTHPLALPSPPVQVRPGHPDRGRRLCLGRGEETRQRERKEVSEPRSALPRLARERRERERER